MEAEKQNLSQLLEKHNVKKQQVDAPVDNQNILNLNKRVLTAPEVDNDKDAFFFHKGNTNPEAPKEKKTKEQNPKPKAKTIPVTDILNVKTKKHRGINTIEDLEKKTTKYVVQNFRK